MADFQSPEVRVSEKRSTPVTYPAFSPGVGAFLGVTEKGPVNTPIRVFGSDDAAEVFGAALVGSHVMDEVTAFFSNGGESCFISRVVHFDDPADESTITAVKAATMLKAGATNALLVEASSPGAFGNFLRVSTQKVGVASTSVRGTVDAGSTVVLPVVSVLRVSKGDTVQITKGSDTQRGVVAGVDTVAKTVQLLDPITVPTGGYAGGESVQSETLTLQVFDKNGVNLVTFRNLRMNPSAEKDFIENKVNNLSRGPIQVTVQSGLTGDLRPDDSTYVLLGGTTAGSDGDTLTDLDYVGAKAGGTGLYAFDNNEDFLLISIPGITSVAVAQGLEQYLESRQDIFGLVDPPQGVLPDDAVDYVKSTANLATSYAATYYPWVRAPDARTGGPSSFPPSGYVMGMFARTFAQRNFGKAPAGVNDGRLYGVTGLDYEVLKPAYDVLYPNRINAIQKKRGYGIVVMGSRTLDGSGDFGQINTRIVFLVVKRIFKEGTQFVLFEGNTTATRAQVTRFMTTYLRGLREASILDGETDDDAFFVLCNEDNNGPTVRKQGKLRCRVGLNIPNTIEFVDITLEQDTRAIDAELASEVG